MKLLAHSAQPKKSILEQAYHEHIMGVFQRAQANVEEILKYAQAAHNTFRNIVLWAACFHDLGKLDEENQEVLNGRKKAKCLPVNHKDAGVSYLKEKEKKIEAAILILSHHKPGMPSFQKERDREFPFRDVDVKQKTDENLDKYLYLHQSQVAIDLDNSNQLSLTDGLSRRLALSCLVDADYSDSSHYEKPVYKTRWEERLIKLDEYVHTAYEENEKSKRNELRNNIYFTCRNRDIDHSIYYCDSPVGTGKTTAIMAHMIQVAIQKNLRHIIIVLPFNNIIRQSVKVYREALVLDGEDPESTVAEHDHQADFSSFETRELAALWNAPIIVTTAVQFFETLGSNEPARLRKLHELPGSGIFIDESHASMPTWLWPQAWIWLQKLLNEWGCHLVLASGTTAKFWEIEEFINSKVCIPELIPETLRKQAYEYEQKRVKLKVISNISNSHSPLFFKKIDDLVNYMQTKKGPRLVIMNTVFTAAYLADRMKKRGLDVLHLSTALTPKDREPIIKKIYERLKRDKKTKELNYKTDWTLVATSCAEVGLNFSFRNGFAELRSIQSYLQISGRVNREGEYHNSEMWCFSINDPNIKAHPGFKTSQKIFRQFIESNMIGRLTITELITETIRRELKDDDGEKIEKIKKYEKNQQYPEVADICKLIDSDTRLVVIDPRTIKMLENGEKVSSNQLIMNSVQIWSNKINELSLSHINGHCELYRWYEDGYDSEFLGYMKGALAMDSIMKSEVLLI